MVASGAHHDVSDVRLPACVEVQKHVPPCSSVVTLFVHSPCRIDEPYVEFIPAACVFSASCSRIKSFVSFPLCVWCFLQLVVKFPVGTCLPGMDMC